MPVTVKFAPSGQEREYAGDTAVLLDGFIVVKKWDRNRRALQSAETFNAGTVEWVRTANGDLVLGTGRVQTE